MVRPWPDWFLAMALNLHQVLNQLTFESIPSVFCSFVDFEINTNLFLLLIRHLEINSACLEYNLSFSSFGCWIAI